MDASGNVSAFANLFLQQLSSGLTSPAESGCVPDSREQCKYGSGSRWDAASLSWTSPAT